MRKISKADLIWYWFVNMENVGIRSLWLLLDHFGHPAAVREAGRKELSEFLKNRQIDSVFGSLEKGDERKSIESLDRDGIHFIHWESEEYPERLRHIFQPPLALYYRGTFPNPGLPSLAMVGSRRATNYGRSFARKFAGELSEAGIQIISGLAAGVDTESHKGALEAGGYTAGVLGGGIDTVYPQANYNLYRQMYAEGGVISEYNRGIPNFSGLFPMRNRIISGLSDGVFVLEAGEKSGSLITADLGLEQGREIFALPGRTTDKLSRGCNWLIRQGAIPVDSVEDILSHLTGVPGPSDRKGQNVRKDNDRKDNDRDREDFREQDNTEQRALDLILNQLDVIKPFSLTDLVERTKMDPWEVRSLLLKLELSGKIRQPVQGMYLRKIDS